MGFMWAVLEPVAMMVVLTFVFGYLLPQGRGGLGGGEGAPPFAVMLLCGLIFWQYTATSLSHGVQSLIENQNLVKKVFFTREVIPLAAVTYPLVNLAIGFAVLILVHLGFGGGLHFSILLMPLIFIIQFCLTAGLTLLLSCGNVHYRDIGYITGVVTMFGFYASPVFYPLHKVLESERLPEWAVSLYLWNPMAGLLTAYRQILFENRFPDLWLLAWPSILAVLALVLGAVVFRRFSPTFSDHL
jgi:ABC-type polysaccharide/polyol phosphate export permease